AIPNGQTQISGEFTEAEAQNLADILQYGSLPLSFESSDATTVSPTLGRASLEAGLTAGAIGIARVFVYCLVDYRMLCVLTVFSLEVPAVIVYGVLVLLGRWIGFTLALAGVAGFIIAIGITADSFVVYFERLKDELRDGKSFRSAVPRSWSRARRTILASDAIMFLCAGVLYALAVGEVRGFAFTLGMSTVLDLIVVFLVTHPLVAMVSKSKKLSSPTLSGLGAVQRLGKQRRGGVHISATKGACGARDQRQRHGQPGRGGTHAVRRAEEDVGVPASLHRNRRLRHRRPPQAVVHRVRRAGPRVHRRNGPQGLQPGHRVRGRHPDPAARPRRTGADRRGRGQQRHQRGHGRRCG